ncbi:cbb3-type cytochrome c oxidase N-terminal domain-containing protein [Opitutus sp. GAS368]|uniref:cbb3-type cytochrome c oxidase N-terminal domain-containing protein n=1 Tax=Opitutus sp. GAS368 TaxID=1882749 RepID=UPI00087B7530|nr:cbb3-type cytochrome c oxidase N-terminal domain-containing protein [Opitutus sp. GAS368]SDR75553.1 cytochrome c oxidase cbb3-type subunit 3 [Opitutus sp. GAS368]
MPPSPPPPDDPGIKLREHTYDGIQEYDQRLPNWWLYTLYGAILFWIVYWFAHMISGLAVTDGAAVDAAMNRIAAAKMASSIDVSNDARFWEMARNPVFVDAGRQTFNSLCIACHLASLRGKSENPAAVGPDLTDTAWLHGGTPKEVFATVSKGVLTKGMPAWEPVLGQKKTAEVVAYVLSHHQPGEPITVEVPK